MVRTKNGNFIDDKRRINVALTRARHGLVIVGDADNLKQSSPDWKILLKEMKNHVVSGLQDAKDRVDKYREH